MNTCLIDIVFGYVMNLNWCLGTTRSIDMGVAKVPYRALLIMGHEYCLAALPSSWKRSRQGVIYLQGMVNLFAAASGSRDTRMGTDSANLVTLFLAFSELA
jgi:hypothetical protein